MRRDPPGRGNYLPAAVVTGIVVLIVATAVGWWAAASGRSSHDAARRTTDLIVTSDRLVAAVVDAETSQRGFLLTGREAYRAPYDVAVATVPDHLTRLEELVADDPALQPRVARLRALVELKLAELDRTLDEGRTTGAQALAIVNSDQGRQLMEAIRGVSRQIRRSIVAQSRAAQAAEERSEQAFILVSLVAAVILLCLLVAMLALLRQRTRIEVVRLEDQRRRRELLGEMQRLSTHDALTGLPNRRLLEDRIDQALARAARTGHFLGLFFIDVDGFRHVNDVLGHAAGDELLVQVTERLASAMRGADTIARLSGDDFVALVEDLPEPGEVELVAARIASQLDADYTVSGEHVPMSVSVGVVVTDARSIYGPRAIRREAGGGGEAMEAGSSSGSGELLSASTLLSAADMAVDEAKEAGRARHRVFDPHQQWHRGDRHALSIELRRSLARPPGGAGTAGTGVDELWVAYQPLVDLATDDVIGVEALARWTSPARGAVSPEVFIPVAEDSGLIVELGARVLVDACSQMAQWNAARASQALASWQVSVNCSVRQLLLPAFTATVVDALSASGLKSSALILEITESVLIEGADAVISRLRELTALGVTIALDDFGTGYSSLSYLRHLPIELIKIDRSFVGGLSRSADDEAVVEAVVTLARRLGRTVLAEGIETPAQAERATALGCRFGQGYLYSKPVPADALASASGVPLRQG